MGGVDRGIGFGGMDIGTGFVVAGMADVEGAVACVFTGIRRGGLRCSVFLVLRDVWEAKYSNKFPMVATSCNMLKHSLQRRVVENWLVFERSLLSRWFLGS